MGACSWTTTLTCLLLALRCRRVTDPSRGLVWESLHRRSLILLRLLALVVVVLVLVVVVPPISTMACR